MRSPSPSRRTRFWALALASMLQGCSEAPEQYVFAELARGDVVDAVTATGTVNPRTQVNVGSPISGTVSAVCVDRNDRVRRGQPLATLEARLLDAQLARAKAACRRAEAGLRRAQLAFAQTEVAYGRTGQLHRGALAAQADLEAAALARADAQAARDTAAAALSEAQAELTLAEANRQYATLKSPIDGVVIDRQVEVGQTLAAQFQVATTFTIAQDLGAVTVMAAIDEADMGKVAGVTRATFVADAYPDLVFEGAVRRVRPAPLHFNGSLEGAPGQAAVVAYVAEIEADNPNLALRMGMTVAVKMVVAKAEKVLRLPAAALRFRPSGDAIATADAPLGPGRGRVYVARGVGGIEAREVALGPSDGQAYAVRDGLTEQDRVVVATVAPGQAPPPARRGRRG